MRGILCSSSFFGNRSFADTISFLRLSAKFQKDSYGKPRNIMLCRLTFFNLELTSVVTDDAAESKVISNMLSAEEKNACRKDFFR